MRELAEKYIQEYDKVIVLKTTLRIVDIFSRIISQQETKKVLLLVREWDQGSQLICGTTIRPITNEEYCGIEKLYHMYEFSDRIHIINDSKQYGGLDNYVSTGLLTEEEALTAWLR